MRLWMIVFSSAMGAIVVAAALALPELLSARPSEIGSTLTLRLPALAVAAFAAYALIALLLTTATLVAGTLRVRRHLGTRAPDRVSTQRDWITAFGSNGFRQLAPRLVPALAPSGRADGAVALQTRFTPSETRREMARLHYIFLARSHFFSALIVLMGFIGLGLAQEHGSPPLLSGGIPTNPVILILVGLILLAVLSRIAIDVAAEPLLESISQLPAENIEVGLLRRAVELLETACEASAISEKTPTPTPHLPERLVAGIEQAHRALLDAVGRLSVNTQTLGTVMQSSVETLEMTMRTTAAQIPHGDDTPAAAGGFPELQAAVVELTAVLQRLSAVPEDAEEAHLGGDPAPRLKAAAPGLARELRSLLKEIEGAR